MLVSPDKPLRLGSRWRHVHLLFANLVRVLFLPTLVLRRPELSYADLAMFDPERPELPAVIREQVEIRVKYAGYIARQDRMIRDVARHEKTLIPDDFEYSDLTGLTLEAREKLARIRPKNLGQAGRIPGVSPSDVAQLSIALAARGK